MINPSRKTANFHYAIRNVVRAAEQLERDGREVLYLNIGDPQVFGFRPPDHVIAAAERALHDRFTGYAHSTGLVEAREAIAAYASATGTPTSPPDVLITAGASEAADLVLSALLDEGDEVLLPAPGYPIYAAILSKSGAVARYYQVDERRGWQPSAAAVAGLINARTRAIVLINPNNPTGSITPDDVTIELLDLALRNNLLVISDEVYRDLCFAAPPTAAGVFAAEMGVPLITLESLSKTHMLPGWRVGWMRYTCAEKMRDLIPAIVRLASGRLCAPTVSQYAIKPALEGDRSFIEGFIGEVRKRRDLSLAHIAGTENLSVVAPQAAFYMMIKVLDTGGRTDEEFVLDLLRETGVLVVHGSGFGCDPRQGFFRIVYLAGEESLDYAFSSLRSFLENQQMSVR